jgi:PIN domain nuclease of toxin-antitoxin system
MARYLLDTNVLVNIISGDYEALSNEILEIFDDYSNQLFTSSIAVLELQQLHRIGKIKPKKYRSIYELVFSIENDFNIPILPFGKEQSLVLSKLISVSNHNDPFDHAIISHAISDKLNLVSSDRKFDKYLNQNLKFVFNKR